MNIAIIDYDLGNTASVGRALELLGYRYKITRDAKEISAADCLILPGVGAFNEAMHKLNHYNLIDHLNTCVVGKQKPIVGICLGMQLLASDSYENGYTIGLGWIPGSVIRFREDMGVAIPHVGWNEVHCQNDPIFKKLPDKPDFYFDHSYHFNVDNKDHVKAIVNYGEPVVAVVQKENIIGLQFHPEKSSKNGLRLLRGILGEVESC